MTPQEADKVIAEYMGGEVCGNCGEIGCDTCRSSIRTLYSDSLDALVPVWSELNLEPTLMIGFDSWECHLETTIVIKEDIPKIQVEGEGDTIQEAAAIATAKAILSSESPG